MPRSILLALAVALLPVLLLAGPAFSALRFGTDGAESLVGTNGNDMLIGLGGNDVLKGKAGNDVYAFADGWGQDTIVEQETYQVGGQTVPGGTDTLSFKGVRNEVIEVSLIPEWGSASARACGGVHCGDAIDLSAAQIENVVGSKRDSADRITGGTERNVLNPGGGVDDVLIDLGGFDDGAGGKPALPASSDTYKRLTTNTGTIRVSDWGGKDDVLDLRPLDSGEIYLTPVDADLNRTLESLQVVISETSQVLVLGHFGPYLDNTQTSEQQGQIETLLFADEKQSGVSAAAVPTAEERLSRRQQRLAKAAPRLLAEAQADLQDEPEPGQPPRP